MKMNKELLEIDRFEYVWTTFILLENILYSFFFLPFSPNYDLNKEKRLKNKGK